MSTPDDGRAADSKLWDSLPTVSVPLSEREFIDLVDTLSVVAGATLDMSLEDAGLDSLGVMELVAVLNSAGVNLQDELIASWATLRDVFDLYGVSGGFSSDA